MEDGIRQASSSFVDALTRGDAAAAAALYADDGKLLTPAAELIAGRGEIEAYWRAGIAVGLAQVELVAAELQLGSGIAVEIGRYVLGLDGDGGAAADRGKYLVLHQLQADGTWRRAVDVFNPDAPTGARLDPEEER